MYSIPRTRPYLLTGAISFSSRTMDGIFKLSYVYFIRAHFWIIAFLYYK